MPDTAPQQETCCVPDCTEPHVFAGLCMAHAEDEYGPANPTVEDLVGPL